MKRYKTIDFDEFGGFPLTQETMEFLQRSYADVLEAVSRIAGQYVILSGLTETAPNIYSDGWITFNGFIIPVIGGIGQTYIKTGVTTTSETYRDGSVKEVLHNYYAQFDAFSGVTFTSFQRISLESLKIAIDAVNIVANNALALALALSASTQSFTPGMIMMWSGNPGSLPNGWGLCDGVDGRPNLKGRFIVGYDATDSDYNAIAKVGGSKMVTLSVAQMPSHNHTMLTAGNHQHYVKEVSRGDEGNSGTDQSVGSYNETGVSKFTSFGGDHSHTINNTGSGQAHENRPPYYVLAYIVKL